MYNLKFISDSNNEIVLNYENGIVISKIDGATGLPVTTRTAQGYQQVGVSISALTVDGRSLTLRGFIFSENSAKKQALLSAFAPFVRGRLYWEDRYWIDVVVKDTPEIAQNKDSTFSMRLFAPDPYWRAAEKYVSQNGITVGSFQFPVVGGVKQLMYKNNSLDAAETVPHRFGTKTSGAQFIITNNGQAEAPFEVIIEGSSNIVNPTITNTATGAFLKWNDTIELGERLRIYNDRGRIRATLTTTGGVETNAIAGLDDDSTLFTLAVGDNLLQTGATTGANDIETTISFYPLFSGVLMRGV